jgi:hypothetical protein
LLLKSEKEKCFVNISMSSSSSFYMYSLVAPLRSASSRKKNPPFFLFFQKSKIWGLGPLV